MYLSIKFLEFYVVKTTFHTLKITESYTFPPSITVFVSFNLSSALFRTISSTVLLATRRITFTGLDVKYNDLHLQSIFCLCTYIFQNFLETRSECAFIWFGMMEDHGVVYHQQVGSISDKIPPSHTRHLLAQYFQQQTKDEQRLSTAQPRTLQV